MRLTMFIVSMLLSFSLWADVYEGYTILAKAENDKTLPVILVPPSKLLPTQTTLGQIMVRDIIQDRFGERAFANARLAWDKTKNLDKNLRALKADQLLTYVETTQKNLDKKPVNGAFTSSGIYHFDGHHRSRALYEVNQLLSAISSDSKIRFFMPVRLTANYSNPPMTDKEIAKDIFITKGQGYVSASIIKAPVNTSAEDLALLKYNYLKKNATNLAVLTDDPYRTLIGSVFFDAGIESDTFVTYFEFHLEELFKTQIDKALAPSKVYPGMPMDEAMSKKVKAVLFSDPKLVHQIAYWARLGNLTKEEAFERCTLLEKKDDKTEIPEELKDEAVCKKNLELLLKAQAKK